MSVAFNKSSNGGHVDAAEETTSIKARYFDCLVLSEDERIQKDAAKAVDISVFKEVYAQYKGKYDSDGWLCGRVTAYAGLIASKGRFVGNGVAAQALGADYKSYVNHLCNTPTRYTNDRKQICAMSPLFKAYMLKKNVKRNGEDLFILE